MKTVHLIQHTHWDREWYFTENDSKVVLYYFMLDLITRLEQDEALGPFILDGQTVMLEDFLQVASEHRARLQKLITDGRVLIGPWYTQSDFLVVGAESITRNLLLGLADCKAWGSYMPVGYVPDSFGQSAQLPMFLREFAIDSAVLWRGWSEHDVPTSEFNWQAQGGQQVLTAVLPWGYGCAKWLPTASQELVEKLPPILEKQARFSATNHLLLPNGNDQSPFEYAVPAALEKLNTSQSEYHFRRSSFSDFFAALRSDEHKLPVLRGELLSPKYMRIHRGIFSTRMDIKQLNVSLEQFVSQTLEPLLAVNWRLGLSYPQQAVEHIWREAMKSHAHDSIGGCNSDRVNQMVKGRLQSGKESAEQLFDLNMKMLAEGIEANQHGKKIVVFNPLPARRDTQVSLTLYTPEEDFRIMDGEGNPCRWQLLHEEPQDMSLVVQELSNSTTTTWYRKCHILLEARALPACGYKTFYLQEGEAAGFEIPARQSDCLENAWLRLEHKAGELTLTDKRTGEVYPHILRLVDGEDAGDNYNYSPPTVDWKISSEGCLQQAILTRGVLKDTLQLTLHMPAPVDAEARHARRLDARLDAVMTISLPHDSAWLDVDVEVNNTLRDHRLQVELPTGVHQTTHFADQPFGLIERENVPRALEIWQQENWTEMPASLWPMQSLVMMHQARRGLGVVTAGLREYEIPVGQPDTLAITLFRSVGWLGRPALEWRPGRASGMVLPAPESQIPGRHEFHFAVMPMNDGQSPAFWRAIEQWRTPTLGYLDSGWSRFRTNPHGKIFPPHFSVLSWESALHFSTLKKAQNEEALVLRGWNPGLTVLENLPPAVNATPQQITLAEIPATPTDAVEAGTPVSWLIRSFE
ncbi:glycoside hydrolase family 38 C-terminal domain-containing protein [Cedecea sp. NFIX57]|uniref:glycoside hydrolase family 38 N-terminal domain-containing protein n=1 Tax=Cedecea sp. NFIX57 TaxID=1566286 RepID=UPI000A0A9A10|nr:glycoside hydrolase family 38 C-terminal domain-containing protein [Cedecea sp. NFIX57]SMG24296.1 mannosylglycerate hydrolase [Cedecea sp. NFIX57]